MLISNSDGGLRAHSQLSGKGSGAHFQLCARVQVLISNFLGEGLGAHIQLSGERLRCLFPTV